MSRLHIDRDGWRDLCLSFLSADSLLVCGWQPRDPLLRLWRIEADLLRSGDSPLRRLIDSGGGRIGAVALAAQGQYLACVYSEIAPDAVHPQARLWVLPRGRLVAEFVSTEVSAYTASLAFTGHDGLATGHDGVVSLWSLADGALRHALPCFSDQPVSALACAGDHLAAAAGLPHVPVWRLPHAAPLAQIRTGGGVCALALSPDGGLLACAVGSPAEARRACEKGQPFAVHIEMWRLDEPRHIATLETGAVTTPRLYFSPDGGLLAAACGDLLLWDTAAWTLTRLHGGPGRGCMAAAFAPDGELLATGGGGGLVDVWAAV